MSVQPPRARRASSGLPAVNQALEPAWVRHGSAATQKAYETALAFEQMLVEQLSQVADGDQRPRRRMRPGRRIAPKKAAPAAGGAAGQLSSMLPQALTSGVMSAGGLGLAAQMTRQLAGAAAQAPGDRGNDRWYERKCRREHASPDDSSAICAAPAAARAATGGTSA